jgi:tetratricopeptide (TPR) repeat protein
MLALRFRLSFSVPHPLQIKRALLRSFIGVLALFGVGVSSAGDPLPETLAGEFALQQGRVPDAARHYRLAALAGRRPDLIERATTVALYARDYPAAREVAQRWLLIVPDSIGARRAMAWVNLADGELETAERWLSELLAAEGLEGQRAAAQVLVAAENRTHAPALLARLSARGLLRATQSGPNWSAIASHLGENAIAAELIEAETRKHPKNADSWRRAAQVHVAAGNEAAAERALRRALELAPEDFDTRLSLASLLSGSKRVDAADKILAAAPEHSDRVYAARIANAAAEPSSRLLRRIARALERASKEEVSSRAFLLGQLAELGERNDDAIAWYDEQPAGPAWHDAQLRRAVLLAEHRKDADGMRRVLATARERAQSDEQRVDAFLLEAEMLAADPAAVAAVYAEALSKHPRDVRLLYARALHLVGVDDIDGAERDLRAILRIDPDNPQVLNALGYTLADRTDRYGEALQMIEKALAAHPDDAAFVDSMGWVQYRLGNLDKALEYLRRAYALAEDGEIAAHLAEVLWVKGERAEAEKMWRQALERWPDNGPLLESVRRLRPELAP